MVSCMLTLGSTMVTGNNSLGQRGALSGTVLMMLITQLVNRPYQSVLHNAGVFLNQLLVLSFLLLLILRQYMPALNTFQN